MPWPTPGRCAAFAQHGPFLRGFVVIAPITRVSFNTTSPFDPGAHTEHAVMNAAGLEQGASPMIDCVTWVSRTCWEANKRGLV